MLRSNESFYQQTNLFSSMFILVHEIVFVTVWIAHGWLSQWICPSQYSQTDMKCKRLATQKRNASKRAVQTYKLEWSSVQSSKPFIDTEYSGNGNSWMRALGLPQNSWLYLSRSFANRLHNCVRNLTDLLRLTEIPSFFAFLVLQNDDESFAERPQTVPPCRSFYFCKVCREAKTLKYENAKTNANLQHIHMYSNQLVSIRGLIRRVVGNVRFFICLRT